MNQTLPRPEDAQALDLAVGQRLRELRRAKGMSLGILAERSKMSIGFLSQVERGLSSPSLRVLATLADVLGIGLAALVEDGAKRSGADGFVTRESERPELKLWRTGVSKQLLSAAGPDSRLNLFMVMLEPGGSTGDAFYSHDGEEAGLVLEGTMLLVVEDREWTLQAGDSFRFASRLPHRFANPAPAERARVLWVNALSG